MDETPRTAMTNSDDKGCLVHEAIVVFKDDSMSIEFNISSKNRLSLHFYRTKNQLNH